MILLPYHTITVHKNGVWDWLESKCVVAFSYLQLLRNAEVSPAALAALTLTFLLVSSQT